MEVLQRVASVSGAVACAAAAGVLRGRRDRRRRRAPVRFAGLQLRAFRAAWVSSRTGSSATRRCSCWRATRTASPRARSRRCAAIPGVRAAAPLLEASANAIGPRAASRSSSSERDSSLAELGGSARASPGARTRSAGIGAIVLPAPLARTIGVTKFGKDVTLQVGGQQHARRSTNSCRRKQIGPLIESPIAVAPLDFVQELTGLQGRVSRILVAPRPGGEARCGPRCGDRRRPPERRVDRLRRAAVLEGRRGDQPIDALFAVISALVGFLFAFNAMLLTVPQRRRLIADLRRDGYTPGR